MKPLRLHPLLLLLSVLPTACGSGGAAHDGGDGAREAGGRPDAASDAGPDGPAADAPFDQAVPPFDAAVPPLDAPVDRPLDMMAEAPGADALDAGGSGDALCVPEAPVETTPAAVCGNGVIEIGEACDPPNALPTTDPSACLPTCSHPTDCAKCEARQTGRSCRDFSGDTYFACEGLLGCLNQFILDAPVPGSVGIVDVEYAYCDRADSATCQGGGAVGLCKPAFEAAGGTLDPTTILASMRDASTPVGTAVVLAGAGYASPCNTAPAGCFAFSPRPRRTVAAPCAAGCPTPTPLAAPPACANPAAAFVWTEDPFDPQYPTGFWSAGADDAWRQKAGAPTLEHWDGASWTQATPPWGLAQVPTWGNGPANAWFRLASAGDLAWWNGSTWRIVLSTIYPTNVVPVGNTGAWIVADNRMFEWDGVAGSLHERTPASAGRKNWIVAVAAPNDVWAVYQSGYSGDVATIEILRWDGASWHHQDAPSLRNTGLGLVLWAGPGPDVWLMSDQVDVTPGAGELWHFNGAWSNVPNVASVRGGFVGRSGNDVWSASDASGGVSHFDGTTWSLLRTGMTRIVSFYPDGAGSVWAQGDFDGRIGYVKSKLLHWHRDCAGVGSNLARIAVPSGGAYDWTVESASSGDVLLAASPNDVWSIGSGLLVRWDGIAWREAFRPTPCDKIGRFNSLWASGPGDVWAGAVRGLLHWDGTRWERGREPPPAPEDTSFSIDAIWGFSPNDVWVIRRGSVTGPTPFHWDGARWAARPIAPASLGGTSAPSTVRVTGLWGAGPNDLWALGQVDDTDPSRPLGRPGAAAFVHWDGQAWTAVGDRASPAFRYRSVGRPWGLASNDIWAIGSGPTLGAPDAGFPNESQLWHYDGTAWTVAEEKTSVVAVWGSGRGDRWFGRPTDVQHWDGVQTTALDLGSRGSAYNAGFSPSSSEVWIAVGSLSLVLHGAAK
jgi:hypothetical protein